MSNIKIACHAFLAVTVLSGAYYGSMILSYAYQMPAIVEFMRTETEATAKQPKPQGVTPQQARDIVLLTASLIYENLNYPDSDGAQEDAYRFNATSIINKKTFEGKKTFEALITEKTAVCQYSWYCENGKPADLKYLKANYKTQFPVAYQMAVQMVLGGFAPMAYSETEPFDGAYYATVKSYNSAKSWHRKQVELGKMCKRRTVDDHVYIAPKIKGNCKKNQLAFFGG